MRYLDTGWRDPSQTLASWFEEILQEEATELRLQTGFFSIDSIGLLLPSLELCKQQDRLTKVLIGSNDASTLKDDVAQLIDALGIPRSGAQLGVVNFSDAFFHPKTYHIKRLDGSQAAFVGSANLTASGLALHVEAGIALDTRDGDAVHHLTQIAAAIDDWFKEQRDGITVVTSLQTVDTLVCNGILSLVRPPRAAGHNNSEANGQQVPQPRLKRLFQLPKIQGASSPDDEGSFGAEVLPETVVKAGTNKIFLMTLQNTDVGIGQTTKGATRRSPEIFIPLAARNAEADFWGWPNLFQADSENNYMKRNAIKMRIGTIVVDVNMMISLIKHDLRLRSEQLRSDGNIGDILF